MKVTLHEDKEKGTIVLQDHPKIEKQYNIPENYVIIDREIFNWLTQFFPKFNKVLLKLKRGDL